MPNAIGELTERQLAVIERLDRRVPIKTIAAELGISATRVNQHVRVLKDLYGANSLADLVRKFRERSGRSRDRSERAKSPENRPLPNDAFLECEVQTRAVFNDESGRDDVAEFAFSDALNFAVDPPWVTETEPAIVPGMLDGRYFVTARLLAMVGGAVGMMSLLVLVLTSFLSLGELFEGRAYVPEANRHHATERGGAEIGNDGPDQSRRVENSQTDARGGSA